MNSQRFPWVTAGSKLSFLVAAFLVASCVLFVMLIHPSFIPKALNAALLFSNVKSSK